MRRASVLRIEQNMKEKNMSNLNSTFLSGTANNGIIVGTHKSRTQSKVKPIRKVKHLVKRVEEVGWYFVRMKGSHRQFKHATRTGIVTISGKTNADVRRGTLNSVLRQAGLK